MITPFRNGMETEISSFIRTVFDRFVGHEYSDAGKQTFYRYIEPQQIRSRYLEDEILLTYHSGDKLTGIIAARDDTHISLFFVDPDCHGRGIGRALFHELLLRTHALNDHLTVNSSRFAVMAYEHLGFRVSDVEQERDGIIFIPMTTEHTVLELRAHMFLKALVEQVGNRAVGTSGNREATDYVKTINESYCSKADLQRFDAIDWKSDQAFISFGDELLTVSASPYANGCDVTAVLTEVSTIEGLRSCEVSEKILLLHGPIAAEQLMPKGFVFYQLEEHQEIIRLLEEKPPAAIVCATGRNAALAGGVYPFPLIEDGDFDIPSVLMKDIEAEPLMGHIGEEVRVSSDAQRIDSFGYNVISTQGSDRGTRILITAHIDAKKGSPGALDNATGVAVLLLVQSLLRDYRGPFLLEYVTLNGEDYYRIPGQMRYLEDYQEGNDILMNINIDGAGYIEGPTAYSCYGTSEKIEQALMTAAGAYDQVIAGEQWVQGDHSMFVQSGYPAIAFSSDWFITHIDEQQLTHTEGDDLSVVDTRRVCDTAMVIADLIRRLGSYDH